MAAHSEDFMTLAYSVFDTISECDGQTDALTMTKTREAIARKNCKK